MHFGRIVKCESKIQNVYSVAEEGRCTSSSIKALTCILRDAREVVLFICLFGKHFKIYKCGTLKVTNKME